MRLRALQGYLQGNLPQLNCRGHHVSTAKESSVTVLTPSAASTALITDRLNTEWLGLANRRIPDTWQIPALPQWASLGDAAGIISSARLSDPAAADATLLALLSRHQHDADELAGRLVLQVMLGRAVNLVRRTYRRGAAGMRGSLPQLSSASVAALWIAIARYPVDRRRQKVSVNLCMDALGYFTASLDDNAPQVIDSRVLDSVEPLFTQHTPPAAVELLRVLAWGVDAQAISIEDASLLTQVYCPAPGVEGGAFAVASRLAITPATVRQRCSRAAQRLARAVRTNRRPESCHA